MSRFWKYVKCAFGMGPDDTMLFRDSDGRWVEYRLDDGKLDIMRLGNGKLPRRWR